MKHIVIDLEMNALDKKFKDEQIAKEIELKRT